MGVNTAKASHKLITAVLLGKVSPQPFGGLGSLQFETAIISKAKKGNGFTIAVLLGENTVNIDRRLGYGYIG